MSAERASKRVRRDGSPQPVASGANVHLNDNIGLPTSKSGDKRKRSKNPCRPKTTKKTSTTIGNDEGVETVLVDGRESVLAA